MVTWLDVSDDEERLMTAFYLLPPEVRSDVLQRLQVAAAAAVVCRRSALTGAQPVIHPPERVAATFLMRCMPSVPCGYYPDDGFVRRYLDQALPLLEQRCVQVILGSSLHDGANADALADDLTKIAIGISRDFMAPDSNDGTIIDAARICQFIEDWRESFRANVVRLASATAE